MTPAVLALNVALAFGGLSLLALSLDRHHRDAFGARVPPMRMRLLRILGYAALALSLAAAIAWDGGNFGPVQWIGSLTGAALLVVAILSYAPRLLRPAALASLPAALAALLVTLQA